VRRLEIALNIRAESSLVATHGLQRRRLWLARLLLAAADRNARPTFCSARASGMIPKTGFV
jgi:hypothetical protein